MILMGCNNIYFPFPNPGFYKLLTPNKGDASTLPALWAEHWLTWFAFSVICCMIHQPGDCMWHQHFNVKLTLMDIPHPFYCYIRTEYFMLCSTMLLCVCGVKYSIISTMQYMLMIRLCCSLLLHWCWWSAVCSIVNNTYQYYTFLRPYMQGILW